MGKKLEQQRRGKGSPAYSAPSHRYKVDLAYRKCDDAEKYGSLRGEVAGFVDDPAHHAVLMQVMFENQEEQLLLAPEGIRIGDEVQAGGQAALNLGNILPLSKVPDGAFIYNIETHPGDGGKMVRSPGSYAVVVSREAGRVVIKLPSKGLVSLQDRCRAQLGVVSGGGRLDKPLFTAGRSFYKMNARNARWPTCRGVKKNPYTHPFGGKQHHPGRSMSVARGAPPGRKVGHIAPASTGRGGNKRTRSVEIVRK